MAEWTVVNFVNDNTVEAVPSIWIQKDDRCFWPPLPGESLQQALKKCTPPESNWSTYQIRQFRNASYDNYLHARRKANKALSEYASDLASEDGMDSLQRRQKRNKQTPHNRKSSSDEEFQPPQTELNPPVLQKRQEDEVPSTLLEQSANTITTVSDVIVEYLPSTSETVTLVLQNDETPSIPPTSAINSNTHLEDDTCTCCLKHARKVEDMLVKILNKQNLLSITLDNIAQEIIGIKSHLETRPTANNPVAISIFNSLELPANNEETLAKLEEYLRNGDKMQKTIDEVSYYGGSCPYDMVKRILNRFFTDDILQNYNWLGKKQKKSFASLKTASLLLKVLTKNLKLTEKEGEQPIKQFLKGAKERVERRNV